MSTQVFWAHRSDPNLTGSVPWRDLRALVQSLPGPPPIFRGRHFLEGPPIASPSSVPEATPTTWRRLGVPPVRPPPASQGLPGEAGPGRVAWAGARCAVAKVCVSPSPASGDSPWAPAQPGEVAQDLASRPLLRGRGLVHTRCGCGAPRPASPSLGSPQTRSETRAAGAASLAVNPSRAPRCPRVKPKLLHYPLKPYWLGSCCVPPSSVWAPPSPFLAQLSDRFFPT